MPLVSVSFKVIPQFCPTHPVLRINHVIRGMSARAFQELSVVFQSMDLVKRYDGL